jgi:hypothetical protein
MVWNKWTRQTRQKKRWKRRGRERNDVTLPERTNVASAEEEERVEMQRDKPRIACMHGDTA